MKKQQFNRIETKQMFQILGGRLTPKPITDPNKDPDADTTADDSTSSSS
ncbi:hypothetical protein [Kordia sp.]